MKSLKFIQNSALIRVDEKCVVFMQLLLTILELEDGGGLNSWKMAANYRKIDKKK